MQRFQTRSCCFYISNEKLENIPRNRWLNRLMNFSKLRENAKNEKKIMISIIQPAASPRHAVGDSERGRPRHQRKIDLIFVFIFVFLKEREKATAHNFSCISSCVNEYGLFVFLLFIGEGENCPVQISRRRNKRAIIYEMEVRA